MWAAGALLFLLLSGQPPFNEVEHLLYEIFLEAAMSMLDVQETEEETSASILRCHLVFPTETWAKVSTQGRDLVTR